MQTEPNLRVLKLCKQPCFKTSIRLEPRASVPVLNVMFAIPVYSGCELSSLIHSLLLT
ncbi:hypothetical protein HMPREF9554_00993 [Treponema phagedenis F0421]|nr:hypothetical protein HMPREF9554_00993 [Treponema phagedenis F0421]